MGVKSFKPTSAARRLMTVSDFAEITHDVPEKSLTSAMKRSGGRNGDGHITRRHQGGGHKRRYRTIDFKRNKDGVPGKVFSVEYDPNRTANIALLHYADGEKRYILAPVGLAVGDTLFSGAQVDIRPGNTLPLQNIPIGTVIHNVELKPGRGGLQVRPIEYGNHARHRFRRCGIDRDHARMRMGRTHEGDKDFVGHRHVVHVLARAEQQALVFPAGDCLTDTELCHVVIPILFCRKI